jgi:hypothetical protein
LSPDVRYGWSSTDLKARKPDVRFTPTSRHCCNLITNWSHMSTDLPDGQITEFPVQPFAQKYSASPFARNSFIDSPVPAHRGAFRDRHKRWAGDAVDAAASAQLGLRPEKRRRTMLVRTAKSCGPDAPTLASSWRATADDGGKRARSPGRARRKPLKPLRGECRVFPV